MSGPGSRLVAPPLQRRSAPDLVFGLLRDAILAGRYRPGERLPTQRALAAELEVNIATVREALGRLEQLRLIEVRHGDAMRVLDWRRSGGLEALAALASVDPRTIAALFEARRLLLVEAARLAAVRRDDRQAEKLAELAGAISLAPADETALLADWAFMEVVIEAAGNLVFQLIMNTVREVYVPNPGTFVALVAGRDGLAPMYEAVAGAIADQEPEAAASAMQALASAQEARMG